MPLSSSVSKGVRTLLPANNAVAETAKRATSPKPTFQAIPRPSDAHTLLSLCIKLPPGINKLPNFLTWGRATALTRRSLSVRAQRSPQKHSQNFSKLQLRYRIRDERLERNTSKAPRHTTTRELLRLGVNSCRNGIRSTRFSNCEIGLVFFLSVLQARTHTRHSAR